MRRLISPAGAPSARVVGSLLLVQALFGVHYYAAKIVLAEIPPLAWATLRVTAAAAIMLPLARLFARGRDRPLRNDRWKVAGLAVFGVLINQFCFVAGLSRTTPTHSSLIICSIPVLTLVLALALGQERVDAARLMSIAISLAGVLTLFRVDRFVWDEMTRGDLLTLVNATSFSLFLVLSRPLLRRRDPFRMTAQLFAWGALGLLPLGLPPLARLDWQTVSAATWGWAVYVVVGATVLAYALNAYALRRVDSSLVALFIYLQPLIAATLDVWLLGAEFSGRLAGAAIAIFAGVYLTVRAGRRRPVTPLPRGA